MRHEMAWVVFGQILAFAGSFVGVKVLINVMGPQTYGQLALGLTVAGVLNLFIYGPIANVIARYFIIYREKNQLNAFFGVLKAAHKIMAAIVLISCLCAGVLIYWLIGYEWAMIVVISSLFGLISGISLSYQSLQSAVRQRKVVALHQGIDVWSRIALSVAMLYLFGNSGYIALLGYLLGTVMVAVSQNKYTLDDPRTRAFLISSPKRKQTDHETVKEFCRYALPFILWAGIAFGSIYGDRWVIQYLFGEREVGIYAAFHQIACSPVSLLVGMINQLSLPIIYECAGDMISAEQSTGSRKSLNQVVVASSIIMFAVTLVVYVFSEFFVRMFTNVSLLEYHNMLWIITLGASIFQLGQILTTKGLYHNQPQVYLWPKVIQAVTFVVIAFLLGRSLGVIGIPISSCISAILYLLAVIYVNNSLEISFEMKVRHT